MQKSAAELCQILRMVTVEIVINSTRVMGVRVTILPVCIVLDGTMLLFIVISWVCDMLAFQQQSITARWLVNTKFYCVLTGTNVWMTDLPTAVTWHLNGLQLITRPVGRAVWLWWCTFSNAVKNHECLHSPPVLPRAAKKSNPRKIICCFLSNSLEFQCEILLVNTDRSGRAVDVDADEAGWTIHEGRVRHQQSWIQTYWTECQNNVS